MTASDTPATSPDEKSTSPLSIRWLVTMIVVLPTVLAAGALATISWLTSRAIAEQLAGQLVEGTTSRVSREIHEYLGQAVRTSDQFAIRVKTNQLPVREPLFEWERPMLDDLLTCPTIAAITFGNFSNESTYLMRGRDGRLEVGRYDPALPRPSNCVESVIDPDGEIAREPIRTYRYDPTRRPWFTRAIDNPDQPIWTDVYFWFGTKGADSQTGAGYTRVIHDPQDKSKIVGVLVVDVTLAALSDYLKQLPFADRGFVFIVDQDDYLVAASEGNVNSDGGRRMKIGDSSSAAARAVAKLKQPRATVRVNGQDARAEASPLRLYNGIEWRLIVVLPESTFLAEAHVTRTKSIYLAVAASCGSLLLGLTFARRLSRPLKRLSNHVARVGGGDFDARLHLHEARELEQLSEDINTMAAGLQHRMELEQSMRIATTVQQSLLPDKMPTIPGLDIVGESRYCETTGGDYYDFLEVAKVDGSGVAVAVGDVTGHGIGAALLMTTARAAVRAVAPDQASLGDLLARVNHVLAADSRHEMYMTLMLAVIDPRARTIRFANAGHDPMMVFDPATGEVTQPEGSDVLLGAMDGMTYENFGVTVPPGATVFIGTDGIWEARNSADEMYGKSRLIEVIKQHGRGSAAQLAAAVNEDLKQFIGPARVRDDITFVAIRFLGHTEE